MKSKDGKGRDRLDKLVGRARTKAAEAKAKAKPKAKKPADEFGRRPSSRARVKSPLTAEELMLRALLADRN